MSFEQFIEYNFAPIIGLIFQIIILTCSKNIEKRDEKILCLAAVLEGFELLTYNLEYMYSSFSYYSYMRTFLSVCGYLIRPMLVYPFIMLIREYGTKRSKYEYLDLILFAVLCVIEIIALIPSNHLVFWFDDDNIFHRGKLGYASQVVTIIYLLEVVAQIVRAAKSTRKLNTLLVVTIFIYCSFSMLFETIYNIKSLGVCACIFSVDLFMFALQTNYLTTATQRLKTISEIDSLTGISNRYYGEKTINDLLDQGKGSFFFIMDINKFKRINDTYGHSIGDEAIVKVAKALKNSVSEDDIVMRLGGDEFAIYCTDGCVTDPLNYVNNIFENINKISLSADDSYHISLSVGCCKIDGVDVSSFDKLYNDADKKLYKAKLNGGNYIEM